MTYQTPLAVTVRLYDRLRDSLPWRDLVLRALGMLFQPREEWARMADEPMRVRQMMLPYAVILCLFGPVVHYVATLTGAIMGPLSLELSLVVQGLLLVIIGAVLNLLLVYGLVQVIGGVALMHGTEVRELQAYRLATYSLTAFWVAQALSHLPFVGGGAVLIGLYSLYSLYRGTERLVAASPADRLKVNLMVPGLALAFYLAILGIGGAIVWLAR